MDHGYPRGQSLFQMPVNLKQQLCQGNATGRRCWQQGARRNLGVLGPINHLLYFSSIENIGSLKWWLHPKPQNQPPGVSSSSRRVETPSQLQRLAFHGKCVSLLSMARHQQDADSHLPRHTECTKKMDFICVWWRSQEGGGWLGKQRKTVQILSLPRLWGRPRLKITEHTSIKAEKKIIFTKRRSEACHKDRTAPQSYGCVHVDIVHLLQ